MLQRSHTLRQPLHLLGKLLEGRLSHLFTSSRTIVAEGSAVPFDRFMEWALYHPETGYYHRAPHLIFGKDGDYFTASQLQPTFGQLVASLLPEAPILELGPGGGEMREAFASRGYVAIGPNDELPSSWSGSVFANEFFDALPVKAGIRKNLELRELLVRRRGFTYTWELGEALMAEQRRSVERYYPDLREGGKFEIGERAADAIRRIYKCLREGTVLIVDYGWTGNEYLRFPEGTLMSYSGHLASSDVLANPGQQDITAHVSFPALIDAARDCGFTVQRFETLGQTLIRALERTPHMPLDARGRAQLKTLLFSMGNRSGHSGFRRGAQNEKGPGCPEPHVMDLIPNGTQQLLPFFLRSSFLFRWRFLGCVLHRCDSP